MANYKILCKSGNFTDSTAWWTNWNTVGTMASSSNVTLSTSPTYTEAPAAPNSTDYIGGLAVLPIASWSGKNVTFQLQAAGVDVAGAAITVTGANVTLGQKLFIQLAVPVITTITVVYRWKITTSTGTCTVASYLQGNTAIVGSIIYKTTGGVPSGDFWYVCPPNAAATYSLTIDDTTATVGNVTTFSVFVNGSSTVRTWNHMNVTSCVGFYGEIVFNPSANTRLSWSCEIDIQSGAKWTQLPGAAYLSELYANPGSTLSAPIVFWPGSIVNIQDSQKPAAAYFKGTVVSGNGSTGSPVVFSAPVAWNVNDKVIFTPGTNSATNRAETETKYVKTKTDAYTYTLSDTAGGAESALTYTHVGADVFNIQRNVKWWADTANSWHVYWAGSSSTDHVVKGMEVSGLTSSGSTARAAFNWQGLGTFEDIVNYDNNTIAAVFNLISNNQVGRVYSRIIVGNGGSSGNSQDGRFLNTSNNGTFNDCWAINTTKVGFKLGGTNNTYNRCGSHAGSNGGANLLPDLYGGWNIGGNYNFFNDCEAHSDGNSGLLLYIDNPANTFTRWISGTKAKNYNGAIYKGSGFVSYEDIYFDTPTIAETTYFTGNANMVEGSQIVMSNVNGTAYNNYKYTNNGSAQFTGSGLSDTTVPLLGSYTYRHAPTTTTGIKYRYLQTATPGATFVTYGKVWGNSTFVSDGSTAITVDLYLPGHVEGVDSPDATTTMTKTTNNTSANAQYLLSALYSGTRPRFASVVITMTNPSATSSAYAYVGDVLNSENDSTKFKLVYKGQPTDIMPLGASTDPGSVAISTWAQSTATTTPGTFGKLAVDVLSNTDATQAKVNNL